MARIGLRRREILAASAATLLGAGIARAEDAVRLRLYWWGATERAERTNKTSALYMKTHPSVTIAGESVGWGDYWTRLATQAAGHNMADLIQMDYGYIYEYARRKALLPLDGYLGKGLDLSGFSAASIDGGRVDGKIYGVSLGLNSTSIVYDHGAFEAYHIAPLDWPVTWAEFAKRTIALTKAAGRDGYWASSDAGGSGPALEVWLRERGKQMYNVEGRFGGDAADMAEWFGYWQAMRDGGGCVPPGVQALDKQDIDTSMLTFGKAAISFANSNQLVGFQALNKNKLALAMFPAGAAGGKSGQYLKPSQMLSVASTSKHAEAAVAALSFFVADLEAGKILGAERGIPASKPVRDAIAPSLNALDRAMSDYIAAIADRVTPLPPPPPKGAGEVLALLQRINETVGFKRTSAADASRQFIKDTADILTRI